MAEQSDEAIRRALARRRRLASGALALGAVAATLRLLAKASWWPVSMMWLGDLWMWAAPPIFPVPEIRRRCCGFNRLSVTG